MKPLLSALLFFTVIISAAAEPLRNIQTCTMEDGSETTLQAQHDPERDADRFYLNMDGKTDIAFTDIPGADYVGDIVLSKCLSHVLIFAISYGAPYFKGVVIRRTVDNGSTHRIDFSEKALPELLYLGKRETRLVIPNVGYEVASKYLVYLFQLEKGQDEAAMASDILPPKAGFNVVRVNR